MVCAVWNCFFVPVQVSFGPAWGETIWIFIFNSLIDVIFLVDIFVQFRTTFMHSRTGIEVA